ncbi:MAG: PIN domain-containing protein [Bacilli bacterium]|nr:PIN domain-containing protein [Bacilli bacterium]
MKVLFDTNVIIDAMTARDYSFKDSQELIKKVIIGEIKGAITAKQITDIYFILRKYFDTEEKRREAINLIIDTFEVVPTLKSDLKYCVNSQIADYEDAVLDEVAKVNCFNFIVTNNIKDFHHSKTAILTPNQLLGLFPNI